MLSFQAAEEPDWEIALNIPVALGKRLAAHEAVRPGKHSSMLVNDHA